MVKRSILRMVIAVACICVLVAFPVRALAENGSNTYTDEEGGVTFTVPEGWTEAEFTEPRQYLDVKYQNDEDPMQFIMYGSIDIWSEGTVIERAGMSREELNTDYFTKQDMVDTYADFDLREDQVEEVTYNGHRYYKAVLSAEEVVLGIKVSVTFTQLFRAENGWGYYFQFSGDESSRYYSDFERLMESARYTQTAETDDTMPIIIAVVALLVVAAVIVTTVLIITSRRKKARAARLEALRAQAEQEAQQAQAEQEALSAQQVPEQPQEKQFCHLCGTQVPVGSEFCHQCGGKL